MRRYATAVVTILMTGVASAVWATNGDNLIGVGPVSRAMGGTGVAAPQDSISAIFANPAGMSFCPCGVESESVFGATIFDPTVKTQIRTPFATYKGTSQHDPFLIPAVGVNMPLGDRMRFGVGAYGISGLGVDYRNLGFDLDGDPSNGFEGDLYSRLEIMKFAPMVSYKVSEELAVGVALQAAYNNLDLGAGGTHDYTYGAQLGAAYNLGSVQLGATYQSPMKAKFDRVFNFDSFLGDTSLDTLELEAPTTVVLGAAVNPTKDLLLALEGKWYDWEGAAGYSDFGWDSQWVLALGAQYAATDKLRLRAGYNYAENPVQTTDNFNPQGVSEIQGTAVPTLGYELFRIVGFPAVVEHHVTVGFGYDLTPSLTANLEYMHAFEKKISETSLGGFFDLESSLAEDSIGFSLAWKFE